MSTHRFGTIDRLAFDIDVEPDGSRLGVAFLRCWAGGVALGATDRTELLATFLTSLARFITAVPTAPPELAGRSPPEIFAAVHGLLNDPDPGRPDFPWDRSALVQRLVLLPDNTAPFDGEWVLLLREPAGDRLIVRRFEDPVVREVMLDAGEVDAVARAVLQHPWRDVWAGAEASAEP